MYGKIIPQVHAFPKAERITRDKILATNPPPRVFHKITNHLPSQIKQLDKIAEKKPKFICMNDDQRLNPNQRVVERVQKFLDDFYPRPSQFEKV